MATGVQSNECMRGTSSGRSTCVLLCWQFLFRRRPEISLCTVCFPATNICRHLFNARRRRLRLLLLSIALPSCIKTAVPNFSITYTHVKQPGKSTIPPVAPSRPLVSHPPNSRCHELYACGRRWSASYLDPRRRTGKPVGFPSMLRPDSWPF